MKLKFRIEQGMMKIYKVREGCLDEFLLLVSSTEEDLFAELFDLSLTEGEEQTLLIRKVKKK